MENTADRPDGPDKRNKKPIKLSTQAGIFIEANSSELFSRGIRLKSAWEEVASPKALEHTDSIVFSKKKENGILVYVQDSHWAAELGMQKELYRILLERETGWEIADIEFYVTKKAAFKKLFKKKEEGKKVKKGKKSKVPLSKSEDRYARELVASIKDEKLKERLYKAIKADFEWKKGTEGLKLSQKPPESPETI
jgi:hypothetical protein